MLRTFVRALSLVAILAGTAAAAADSPKPAAAGKVDKKVGKKVDKKVAKKTPKKKKAARKSAKKKSAKATAAKSDAAARRPVP